MSRSNLNRPIKKVKQIQAAVVAMLDDDDEAYWECDIVHPDNSPDDDEDE
jgi:hypothetical protein